MQPSGVGHTITPMERQGIPISTRWDLPAISFLNPNVWTSKCATNDFHSYSHFLEPLSTPILGHDTKNGVACEIRWSWHPPQLSLPKIITPPVKLLPHSTGFMNGKLSPALTHHCGNYFPSSRQGKLWLYSKEQYDTLLKLQHLSVTFYR